MLTYMYHKHFTLLFLIFNSTYNTPIYVASSFPLTSPSPCNTLATFRSSAVVLMLFPHEFTVSESVSNVTILDRLVEKVFRRPSVLPYRYKFQYGLQPPPIHDS